ncbi:MAG: hypothetical protein IT410_03205 [Candidatus Doudnabacteria bacterium]|nr:hypothetical protein [Candidatus Doudnabacteria bacterium]
MESENSREEYLESLEINKRTGVTKDSFNAFFGLLSYALHLLEDGKYEEFTEMLRKENIRTYEQYLARKNSEYAKKVLNASSQEGIKAFNDLALEFNQQKDQVIANRDASYIKDVLQRADELTRK